MNGAESLVNTLADQGVEICFANPGTSEMHFLAALENPRCAACCACSRAWPPGPPTAGTGCATRRPRPCCTWARSGQRPGQHPQRQARQLRDGQHHRRARHRHLKYDAPLTSDIEGLARPLSHWVRRTDSSRRSPSTPPPRGQGQRASRPDRHPDPAGRHLVGRRRRAAGDRARPITPKAPDAGPRRARRPVLRAGEPTLIILGGKAMRGQALELAGRSPPRPARAWRPSSSARASSAAPAACRWNASPTPCPRPWPS
jgi:acetolactate synthase-1/2/3 large subunit